MPITLPNCLPNWATIRPGASPGQSLTRLSLPSRQPLLTMYGDVRSRYPTCPYTSISATTVAPGTSRSCFPKAPRSPAQSARASGVRFSFRSLAHRRKTARPMRPLVKAAWPRVPAAGWAAAAATDRHGERNRDGHAYWGSDHEDSPGAKRIARMVARRGRHSCLRLLPESRRKKQQQASDASRVLLGRYRKEVFAPQSLLLM